MSVENKKNPKVDCVTTECVTVVKIVTHSVTKAGRMTQKYWTSKVKQHKQKALHMLRRCCGPV